MQTAEIGEMDCTVSVFDENQSVEAQAEVLCRILLMISEYNVQGLVDLSETKGKLISVKGACALNFKFWYSTTDLEIDAAVGRVSIDDDVLSIRKYLVDQKDLEHVFAVHSAISCDEKVRGSSELRISVS